MQFLIPVTLDARRRRSLFMRRFVADFFGAYLPQVRFALLVGMVLYGSFLPLDFVWHPEHFESLALNRGLIVSLTLLAYAFTWTRLFRRTFRPTLFLLHIAVGLGTLHLTVLEPIYYTSIYCVIIFFALVTRAQFAFAVGANIALVGAFFAYNFFWNETPPAFTKLLFETLLMAAAAVVSTLAAYLKETSDLRQYVQKRRLRRTGRKLNEARQTVSEHMRALEKRNQQLEDDLLLARKTQEAFVPRTVFSAPGYECYARYAPVDQVGGDYFDFFDLGERGIGIFIGDVSGHGVPAALITAMLKMTCSLHVSSAESPGDFLRLLNRSLYRKTGVHFLTAFMAFLDPAARRMTYSNAGHCCPLLYRAESGDIEDLDSYGLIMGLLPFDEYEDAVVDLHDGDRLLFYTDGVTETRNPRGQMYGPRRLRKFLGQNHRRASRDFVESLMQNVETHRGGLDIEDDLAMICIDVVPVPAEGDSREGSSTSVGAGRRIDFG